jgi:membrane fusion protein, heavy metal efflux system
VQAESDLATAANALKTAREQLALTTTSENRQHELYLAKSGALKDWLQSKTDLATAQNNLGVAEATLSAVRERLRIMGKSDDEISALEKAPAEHLPNPDALLLAPISGTVTQRAVGVGQYINSVAGGGASPVFTIGNLSTLWLVANVREADAPLVRVGQPIEVHVMAFPGRKFQARITWVAPGIDPGTHRLPVRAEVENPDGALKAMMFASFTIITGKEGTSPGVPESAIVHVGEEARVYVLLPDGTIALRQIRVGRAREDGMMEVAAGLAAGDRIVTAGTLFIDRAVTAEMGDKQ